MIKNRNFVITKHQPINNKEPQSKYFYSHQGLFSINKTSFGDTIQSSIISLKKKTFTDFIYFNHTSKRKDFLTRSAMCAYLLLTLSILPAYGLTIESQIAEGSLIFGKSQPDEQIYLGQTQIPTAPDGSFYFGLPQDARSPLTLNVITKDTQITQLFPIQERKWQEQHISGLPPHQVQISPTNQKRIQNENALLWKQRNIITKDSFPTCFHHPLRQTYRISGAFGNRRIFNQRVPAGHSGTDYAAPKGTPVYAIASGTVALVHQDMFLSGKTVLINHNYGLFSAYSHLSEISVKEGQRVTPKTVIGKIGATGRATGPHLHFTFTWFTTRVDPEQVFQAFPCPTDTEEENKQPARSH